MIVDLAGWLATAVFLTSYFFKQPVVLRRVQMLGAAVWIAYGLLMSAPPIIAANSLLILVAAWTARRPAPVPHP
jgi:hypothetical protein